MDIVLRLHSLGLLPASVAALEGEDAQVSYPVSVNPLELSTSRGANKQLWEMCLVAKNAQ